MKTALIKFGGEIARETQKLIAALRDVADLSRAAEPWRFVICHGGGPQANALSERLGLKTIKVGGRRVTDEATLQVMKQALAGEVSVDVVAAAVAAGLSAVGISSVSGSLVTAVRRPPKVVSGAGDQPIDFGFVGDIVDVRPDLIEHLWRGGYTPVINSLGIAAPSNDRTQPCAVYNINADTVACALAAALKVDHLFLMTDVCGVLADRHDPNSRFRTLTRSKALAAIEDGTIQGGMIPKVEDALTQLSAGVKRVHIVGAGAGIIAAEAAQPGSLGTVLIED
jgi:acetylglutamate kinase